MATIEEKLRLAVRFIAQGNAARIPDGLDTPEFSTPTFRREIAQLSRTAQRWLYSPGVQGIGVGDRGPGGRNPDELAFRVYVAEKLAAPAVPIPERIDVPEIGTCETAVIETGQFALQSFDFLGDPARPGSSIGHTLLKAEGTLGCVVSRAKQARQEGESYSQEEYVLSNSHVIAEAGFANQGDAILHPAAGDGGKDPEDVFAALAAWVPFEFSEIGFPNLVDAAIGLAKKPVQKSVYNIGTPSAVSFTLAPDLPVQKVGRATGWTSALIEDIDFHVRLSFKGQGLGFQDQVLCGPYSTGGDSGSAVCNEAGELIGLHFAGSPTKSAFNKIEHVFAMLQIELA